MSRASFHLHQKSFEGVKDTPWHPFALLDSSALFTLRSYTVVSEGIPIKYREGHNPMYFMGAA